MGEEHPDVQPARTHVSLRNARIGTHLAMVWERIWPLLLPLIGVFCGFLILSWFGIWPLLSDLPRLGLLGLLAVLGVMALVPLKQFRLPNTVEIDARLEQKNNLQHRPISVQRDRQAASQSVSSNSAQSASLWREHQKRMAHRIDVQVNDLPTPLLAKLDPLALRAIVPLILFIAFGVASGEHGPRIWAAFSPQATNQGSLVPRIDVWVSPPAYTDKPPLYLSGKTAALSADTGSNSNGEHVSRTQSAHTVPQGSELVVRVVTDIPTTLRYGLENAEIDIVAQKAIVSDDITSNGSQEYRLKLTESGSALLSIGDDQAVKWSFNVLADNPPVIKFTQKPRGARNGALELSYEVGDDYKGISARAEFVPARKLDNAARPLIKAPNFALSVVQPKTLNTHPENRLASKTSRDLTHHPYAGSKVRLTLIAKDAAGQEGRSTVEEFIMPSRVFRKPLAKAIVEERRNLALDARQSRRVATMIDAISGPASHQFIKSASVFTGLRVAYRGLLQARNDDDLRAVLDLLWDIALDVEDGGLSLAERKLRDAQERLSKALQNGASEKEIEKLMKELRQAMAEFLRELSQQLAKNQPSQQMPFDQNQQSLSKRDLDKMLDRIENLAKSGSKDAARQLLAEMQQMMDNLQAGRHQQQRRSETGDQFSKQMNRLGEMMQRQQEMMEETFKLRQQNPRGGQRDQGQPRQNDQDQGQNGQRQQSRRGADPNQQGEMSAEEFAQAMKRLQQRQSQLGKSLEQFMEDMKNQGNQPGKELGKAGEAMSRAADALGKGEGGPAIDQQGRAMSAMRKGAQQMMQQMQQQMSGERGGTDANGQQRNSQNDPLGRRQKRQGPDFGQSVKIPDEIDAQRARTILEAIRKRLANPARPRLELEYLDRLLRSR